MNQGKGSKLQALMFNKSYFTFDEAEELASPHKPISNRQTKNFYRFRLIEPDKNHYYRMINIKPGIEGVLMFSKVLSTNKAYEYHNKNKFEGTSFPVLKTEKERNDYLEYLSKPNRLIILVGSHARGDNSKGSDYDFITVHPLDVVIDALDVHPDNIRKFGQLYAEFITNDRKLFNVWKVDPKYLRENIRYRTIDKGHLIGLKNAIKKTGHMLNANGIWKGNKYVSGKEFYTNHPDIWEKYSKYFVI